MTANIVFLTFSVATEQWIKTDKLEMLFILTHHSLYIRGFFL